MYATKRNGSVRVLAIVTLALMVSCTSVVFGQERQLIELRTYKLRSPEMAKLFDRTMQEAGLPAMKRQGIGPVGVFQPTEMAEEDGDEILRYVLIPYPTAQAFTNFSDRLAMDEKLRAGAQEYLTTPKSDPVYSRIESSLLKAFAGMPKLDVPGKPESGNPRLFELRIYESHNELKGKMKVDMFNNGEIDIFRKVGLDAVFFGEALAAKNMPNLTYMLVYKDDETKRQAWGRFLAHPDWERMKGMEQYKDTVSKIISRMLAPMKYSQIQ